jgi:acyl-CoA dehydrogenase
MAYLAPYDDIIHCLENIIDFETILGQGIYSDIDKDLCLQILEEGAKFADQILAPTNRIGDQQGIKLENNAVIVPDWVRELNQKYVEAGWQGLKADPEFGGMGLPNVLGIAVSETMHSANMAYALKPMLTSGTILAISKHGTDAQKEEFLPNLIDGTWAGTMNLTEPHAGSDVGALTTRAVPNNDGTYKIYGQKIFITWGDHDLNDNMIHLVLARLPDAPNGPKGISLFIVPKFLKDDAGNYTIRNDAGPIGIEHKLGIHLSPTCVMAYGDGVFGDETGAIGYLLGEENKGLACMFTMMNEARLDVGLQGVAIAEAATQHAINYANERRQGRAIGETQTGSSLIIKHPDIKRMILTMKAKTQMARAICYNTAFAADMALIAEDKSYFHALEGFLTPIAKAWSTDIGVEVASMGVQIHGGMGFIEETGAAQYYRDARIAPIYEGTNSIQANDLIGRKLAFDNGKIFFAICQEISEFANEKMAKNASGKIQSLAIILLNGVENAKIAANKLIEWQASEGMDFALSNACNFLKLCGNILGSYYLAKGVVNGQDSKDANNNLALLDFAFANFIGEANYLSLNIDNTANGIQDFVF